jgi:hypothetical protein
MEDDFQLSADDYVINENISLLNEEWRTEAHCPEILPFKSELVNEITAQLKNQQVTL